MSKFTKLINNPKLFFRDALKKRKKPAPKKPAPKKPAPKKPETLLLNNINFILPIKFILHTGEKNGALAHLNIWIEYFEDANIDYIILTRHIEAYSATIEKYPYLKVIFAKNKPEIDNIIQRLPLIKACFYPSNTGNNLHLLFYNKINHIFLGHGDSDKTASAHKFFRVYDENWVSGEAHIDRFKNAGFDCDGLEQVKVGRPNLYKVIEKSQTKWKDRFNSKYKVLYLPTWEGIYKEQDYSSLSIIKQNIELVNSIEKLDINIKLHPFSGNREKSFLSLENELLDFEHCNVINKQETVNNCILNSNIFICDISAVVSECLASNAPIFLYIPKDKDIKISKSNMSYEDYCYVFSTPNELIEKLNLVLNGGDFLKDNREKAMEYILNKTATINMEFQKQLERVGE